MKLTLAAVRRAVAPVSIPGAMPYTCDAQAGAYCLVEWADSTKTSIRVRNFNSDSHTEPVAAALRAVGYKVERVENPFSRLNRWTLVVVGSFG